MKLFKKCCKKKEVLLDLDDELELQFVDENGKSVGSIAKFERGELSLYQGLDDRLRREGYDTSELKFDSEGRIEISRI